MKIFQNKIKFICLIGLLLYESRSFGANDATKQLINKTLAKYGIGAGGKKDCNTDKEPFYDKDTGVVRCYDNNGYKKNNYWSPTDRLCKECPYGTILNKNTYQSCNDIKCQDGLELSLPNNKKCPEGYELIKVTNGNCPDGFDLIHLNEKCPDGYERLKHE